MKQRTTEWIFTNKTEIIVCLLLQKAKRNFCAILNGKYITVNRKLWKTIKQLFSDKPKTKYTITLLENKNIAINNSKIVDLLNNIVMSLMIPEFQNIGNFSERISNAVLKAAVKYRKHSSITALNKEVSNNCVSFSAIDKREIVCPIKRLIQKSVHKILIYLLKYWKKILIFCWVYIRIF